MATNIVRLNPEYFPSPTIGRPLANADIYVGIIDLDPEIVGNRKQVSVQQEDGTIVQVAQPISTGGGGIPLYNGSPVTVLVEGNYSLKVLDKNGSQVYYAPSVAGFDPGKQTATDMLALVGVTGQSDGTIVSILGYFASFPQSTFSGGGEFVWREDVDKGTANGGTIIDPDNIGGFDGTLSTRNAFLSAQGTGSGLGCWIRLNQEEINIADFGAAESGTFDDTQAAQAAADYAETIGAPVIISGPTLFESTVSAYTSVRFTDGGFLVYSAQTDPLLHVTSKQSPTSVTPGTVTGLTELSSSVSGFTPKPQGFAIIDSAEELIKRTIGGSYTKDELIVFSDEGGNLSVPVYETHDTGLISTIDYYDPEPIVTVSNAAVRTIDGNFATADVDGVLKASLRDVRFESPTIENIRNVGTNLLFEKTPNATVTSPRIDGSKLSDGYGIRNTITGSVTITSPQIGRCRRGITGRHDKNTVVTDGGYVMSTIDSHYGYNMHVLNGVTVTGEVRFAGRDIRVHGIFQKGASGGIVQRNDTPEIKGVMDFSGNTVVLDTGADWSGLTFGPSTTFAFGRTIYQPDIMRFERNHFVVETAPTNLRYVWHVQPLGMDYFQPKNIQIGCNTIDTAGITPRAISDLSKSDVSLGAWNTVVNISDEDRASVFITDDTAAFDDTFGFDIRIENVRSLTSRVDSTALWGGTIRESGVARLDNETVSDLSANVLGVWDIKHSDIDDLPLENNKHIMATDGFLRLLPTDTAQKVNLRSYKKYGRITVITQTDVGRSGELVFDADEPNVVSSAAGVNFDITTGVLSGTTGTAGKVTVSVSGGALYIENRSGTSRNISYSID